MEEKQCPGLVAGSPWRPGSCVSASLRVGSYGHVPNGARVYYLQRSQPPLLTLMMERYVTHTNDTAFLRWVRDPAALRAPTRDPQGGAEQVCVG